MMEHDDKAQDMDMIKSVLQKIIDEMTQFESDRIMPEDRKPKMAAMEIHADSETPEEESSESPLDEDKEDMQLYKGSYGIPHPNENKAETADEAEPENEFNQHEDLDPTILSELLKKADESDENGELPEERENDLPLDLANLVREKKRKK